MYTVLTLLSIAWLLIENVLFVYKKKELLSEFGISNQKRIFYSGLCIILSVVCALSIFRNHYVELTKYVAIACFLTGSLFSYMSYKFKVILEISGTDRTFKAMEQALRMVFLGLAGTVFSILLLLTGNVA